MTSADNNLIKYITNTGDKDRFRTIFFLLFFFLSSVTWFKLIDVYHHHFFDHGPIIILYNFFRMSFGILLAWMIYAAGYLFQYKLIGFDESIKVSLPQRIIFCFAIGTGVWYGTLFILGLLNLYYYSVMISLSIVVLYLSAGHLNQISNEVKNYITACFKKKYFFGMVFSLITIALLWLFVVRGLYPAGEQDYLTHYYQYYMEVVRNHGIKLSDFWTDYYSEKGFGLYFFAIMLTDPAEVPIISCLYVTMAAFTIFSLANHMIPRSFWPLIAVLLYISYYNIQFGVESDFQKSHEIISAIVVMIIYVISTYELKLNVSKLLISVALMSLIAAATIITVEINAYLALLFSGLFIIGIINKNYKKAYFYFILTCFVFGLTLCILTFNYLTTGLASLHGDIFLHFMNWERLNKWGVIPDLVMEKWLEFINVQSIPFGFSAFVSLALFSHMRQFTISIVFSIVFYLLYILNRKKYDDKDNAILNHKNGLVSNAIFNLIFLTTILFLVLSGFVSTIGLGSFYRFSVFFVPLFIILLISSAGLFINTINNVSGIGNRFLCLWAPILVLVVTILSWNYAFPAAFKINDAAFDYLLGRHSIEQGYLLHPYGHTPPLDLNVCLAASHIPAGNRVLNMNFYALCFYPGYNIESSTSSTDSVQQFVAVNAPAEEIERQLKLNRINYFLISPGSYIRDYLPFTTLFSPDNIGKYLGIKWTNGKEYLLTWRGPDTMPIPPNFFVLYRHNIYSGGGNFQENFNSGIPVISAFVQSLYHSKHPWNLRLSFVLKNP